MRRYLFAALLAVVVPAPMVVHADDWEVQRNPFDPKVIAQYKGILASSPHDGLATDVACRRISPRSARERADADTERLSLPDVRDLALSRGQ